MNGVLWDSETITRVSLSPVDTAFDMRNDVEGDPAFAPDGYHLLPESDAINAGIESGVDVDIDGEPRPRHGAYDLGADEQGPLLFAQFKHSAPHWLGDHTVFTNTSIFSDPVSYHWDFGDGASSTAVSPTHMYTATGDYTVVLTATSGELQDVARARVVVYRVSFISSSPDCLGEMTVFTNTSVIGAPVSYRWDFGDGGTSTAVHPTRTYTVPGEYSVILTATVGDLRDAVSHLVVIHTTSFTSSSPNWLGEMTVFTNTSVISGPVSYRWDFGDGGTSMAVHPTRTYTAAGEYSAVLTATVGDLQYVVSRPVVIYGASFTSSSPDWLGHTTEFTNTSTDGGAAAYRWSFGDGMTSTQEHPMHTYGSPSLYPVSLTVTNDAGFGVATGTVALHGPTEVDFFASPREGISPLSVRFTPVVSTTPPGDPSLRYLWHFAVGDEVDGTSTLPAPVHTYVSTGVYTVSLRVTNTLTSAVAIKPLYITVRDTMSIYLPVVARDS